MKIIMYIIMYFFVLHYCQADYERAKEYFNNAEYKNAENELVSIPESAKVLNSLGLVRNAKGEFKLAMDSYNRALEIANDTMAMIIHLNRGICYSEYGYFENSKKEFEIAAELSKGLNDMSIYSKSLMNIGMYYYQLNNNDTAYIFYRKALFYTNEVDIKASIYNNIALIKEEEGDYIEALEMNKKSLEMERSLHGGTDKVQLSISYSNIGLCYLKMDDLEKASEYLDSAYLGISESYQYDLLNTFMNAYKVKEYKSKIESLEKLIAILAMTIIIIFLIVLIYYLRKKVKKREKQIDKVRQMIINKFQ